MLTKIDQKYIKAELLSIGKYLKQEAGPGMSKFSEITPHLFITNWESACNSSHLKDKTIELVILVSKDNKTDKEMRLYQAMRIQQVKIDIADVPSENITKYFDKFYNLVYNSVLEEKNILIHCETGISSSVAFVLYYLLKRYYITNYGKKRSLDAELASPKSFQLKRIIEYLKIRRTCIEPNMGFVQQLLTAELFMKKEIAGDLERQRIAREKKTDADNEEFAKKRTQRRDFKKALKADAVEDSASEENIQMVVKKAVTWAVDSDDSDNSDGEMIED